MPGRETHYTDFDSRSIKKIDEIPFDYARKFVSTLVTDKNGESQLIMKGDISHRGPLQPCGVSG